MHNKITEGYMPFMGYQTYYRIVGEASEKAPLLLLHASLYENIPHSRWHLFRHARHTCFIDAYEEYCQVLTRWLQEND